MKKLPLLFVLLSMLYSFSSCHSDDEPYIHFKTADGEIITNKTIPVNLNSEIELYVDIGYEEARDENNLIHYERKIDDGQVIDLTFTGDLDILTIGAFNNLLIEKSKINLSFNEGGVESGSIVTIIVRDNGRLMNTLIFEVR
ncbi:MAG: hypothetical protein LUH22_15780 [Bacteroides sp.]|nr:hypothetical protein [Bacteroides sp.]